MKVIDEYKIRFAHKEGVKVIDIDEDTLVTPAAEDLAKSLGVELKREKLNIYGRIFTETEDSNLGSKKIAFGSDHGGFDLKEKLKPYLQGLGYQVRDFGCFSETAVDYPDFARAVAESVSKGESQMGIMIDGAGIGSCMVANKVPGVRAAMCYDAQSALNSREHNDANVLTLGGRRIDLQAAKEIVKVWLETDFGGDRHQRRVDKIMAVENAYSKTR